jgi:uncharacterized membrane protein
MSNLINLMVELSNMIHIMAAVVWIGGMFFAYMALRPAAAEVLEPPQRLTLWTKTFARFFPWVWIIIIALPLTGIILIVNYKQGTPWYVHAMIGLGVLMILIFLHVFFAPYKRLKNAVKTEDWAQGGKSLGQIRVLVGINTLLGMIIVLLTAAASMDNLNNSISNMLHIAGVVIWVGGMFFAYMAQRPAAAEVLEPPQRLTLWVKTFARFFPWVWIIVIAVPLSGGLLVYGYKIILVWHIHAMMGLGAIMILIFLHVFFAPYKRLKNAVKIEDWAEGGKQLGQIRMLIGINLLIGLSIILVTGMASMPSIFTS